MLHRISGRKRGVFVLLGQLISAAAIDHFGLFGAQVSPLTWVRAGGIAVMALGVGITQLA